MASHPVARVEGAIAVLWTPDVYPIPSPCILMLGLNDQMGIADPAMTHGIKVPAWGFPIITALCSVYPAHRTGAMIVLYLRHGRLLSWLCRTPGGMGLTPG
jgi:hypothetical protein